MNLDEALKSVADFLKELRFRSGSRDLLQDSTPSADDHLTGVNLGNAESIAYDKCLNDLVKAVEQSGSFSRNGVQKLLQQMLLNAQREAVTLEQVPEATIKAAVKGLRKALTSQKTYLVYLPVAGIDQNTLPRRIGKLGFFASASDDVAGIREAMCANIMSLKNDEVQKELHKQVFIECMDTIFCKNAIIELEVRAGDYDGALEKAVIICRQAIDVINFFSDLLVSGGMKARLSLVGEGNEVVNLLTPRDSIKMLIAMRVKDRHEEPAFPYKGKDIAETHWHKMPKGPLMGIPLPKPGMPNPCDPVEEVFASVSELLGNDQLSKLENRILSAFQWAGRASVAVRNEEAFLLYMISLESLILGRDTHSEITYQLKLKAAHLLRGTVEARRELMERLGSLYKIRSQIVHSGRFQVSESDLSEAHEYAKKALLVNSHSAPFRKMTDKKQFDAWLDDRLISSPDDDSDLHHLPPVSGESPARQVGEGLPTAADNGSTAAVDGV
jgi:hypothetical protein